MSTARIEAVSSGFQSRPGCQSATASGTSVASPVNLDRGSLVDVVEKEQFTRNGHLAEHLGRFGYALSGMGGRGTTNKLFWSV